MKRRDFLASIAAVAAVRADENNELLLLRGADARSIAEAIRRNDPKFAEPASQLRAVANAALEKGPWNITDHRPKGIDVPPHEYYSEGPYWWPDQKNPNGPYIRKDGERNPDRFDDNHRDIGAMSSAILSLGLGAYFFGDSRYATHAGKVLNAWFLDADTRMNPNLEFGQAVRGINTGRGTGIIDTVSLIHAVQGIVLLESSGRLDARVVTGLRRWFADYLRWMTASEKGLDEKKSGNNHATWWTAQAAAYAIFVNDPDAERMAWDHYRAVLVPGQIRSDGSCPREEARTRSLSYSVFNLDAFSVLCRLAQVRGVDLWHFRAPSGVGLDKAVAYLTPYVVHPEGWRKEQIAKFDANGIVYPGLAGLGLRSQELLRVYHALPRAKSAWVVLTDLIVRAEESAH